jgi:hypothetical protein
MKVTSTVVGRLSFVVFGDFANEKNNRHFCSFMCDNVRRPLLVTYIAGHQSFMI